MLRDVIKYIEQGTRLSPGHVKQSRARARVFCSILFCSVLFSSGGTILVSSLWDYVIKVATFLSKALCLLSAVEG